MVVDSQYFRSTKARNLCDNARKTGEMLGTPPKTGVWQMINEMNAAELDEARESVP